MSVPRLGRLQRLCAGWGVDLDDPTVARFLQYRELLLEWNQRINLTAITDPDQIEIRHFADSVSCANGLRGLVESGRAPAVIDVGAGAGFPGVPLKLALPEIELTLVDSVGKKTGFLEVLIGRLGLEKTRVVTARAEALAALPEHRERYDAAVSRAVASLPVLIELCVPLLRVGGRLVAPRRGDSHSELEAAGYSMSELGGEAREAICIDLDDGRQDLYLAVIEKRRPTPERYPRRVGVAARRPLVKPIPAGTAS